MHFKRNRCGVAAVYYTFEYYDDRKELTYIDSLLYHEEIKGVLSTDIIKIFNDNNYQATFHRNLKYSNLIDNLKEKTLIIVLVDLKYSSLKYLIPSLYHNNLNHYLVLFAVNESDNNSGVYAIDNNNYIFFINKKKLEKIWGKENNFSIIIQK